MLRFTLDDIDVYDRDIHCLENEQWLNDVCISLGLRWMVQETSTTTLNTQSQSKKRICLLDPTIVSLIQIHIDEQEEFTSIYQRNHWDEYDYLLLPLTNTMSYEDTSMHWSVLLFHLQGLGSFHFDSCRQHNYQAACQLTRQLNHWLHLPEKQNKVIKMKSSQQTNSYDCGMYSLCYSKIIYQELSKQSIQSLEKEEEESFEQIIQRIQEQSQQITSSLINQSRHSLYQQCLQYISK